MSVIIAPRRSNVFGKVPTTADLVDGEMGVNVVDGKIYQRSGSLIYQVGSKAEGTVTSVNVAPPLGFITTSSPVTDSGNLSFAWFHPPNDLDRFLRSQGPLNPPSWSKLVPSDIPDLPAHRITSGIMARRHLPYPEDYIRGFSIKTTSTTITVSAGEAFITSLESVIPHSGATISSSRTANTTYHLYLNALGTIERSLVAPGAPYYLGARWRNIITSTRYLGTVFTDNSANYIPQKSSGMDNTVVIDYLNNIKAALALGGGSVLGNGTATSPTDVDLTSRVPITATDIYGLAAHTGTGGLVRFYGWDGSAFSIHSNVNGANTQNAIKLAVDSTPKVQYDVTTGGIGFLWLSGYTYTR